MPGPPSVTAYGNSSIDVVCEFSQKGKLLGQRESSLAQTTGLGVVVGGSGNGVALTLGEQTQDGLIMTMLLEGGILRQLRSEERRVGEECRFPWSQDP